MSHSTVRRHRSYATHAIILRRRDYADADRILTIYTPDLGKRVLIAKGVRKPSSRKAGHVELFTHANLQVAQARTWDIVTEAATVESFRHLRTDLDGIGFACYVCELVDCFSEEDDDNRLIWDLLLLALRRLNELSTSHDSTARAQADVMLRWFELHLLSVSGFQPQFFRCVDCDRELEPVLNYLVLHEGGVLCSACRARRNEGEELEPDVLRVLRFLQSRPWDTVSQVAIRRPLMRQVQSILNRYLLVILERQLKSTDFIRRLDHSRR